MHGKRILLGIDRLMKECDWLSEQSISGPLSDLAVVDPTFNSGQNYLKVLNRLSEGRFRGKISLQSRLEMMRPEFRDAVLKLSETA